MDCIARYKKRTNRKGKNLTERITNEGIYMFNKHINETPNAYEVQVTDTDEITITESTKVEKCFITNITLNDQNTLDEKYIHFSTELNVDVGCYVRWFNENWVIIFRELNPIATHQTFVMRRCNQIFKFKDNDVVYDIPISVTNLTLYSDGLSKGVYITRQDAKRKILVGKNPITRLIEIGDRVMLTNLTVFRVTHIDDFTQEGLIELTALQMAIVPEDDLENNIAHNPNTTLPDYTDKIIIGSDEVYLGQEIVLTINDDIKDLEVDWSLASKNNSATITSKDTRKCNIKVIGDSRHIGQVLVVDIYDNYTFEVLETKMITIKGYF